MPLRARRLAPGAIAPLAALLVGCGVPDDDPTGATGWHKAEEVFRDDAIIAERVSYLVDGLRVFGQVCYPRAPGRYPIVVNNHGGFSGLGAAELAEQGTCRQFARAGYVLIESSYRGEDGSDGAVEVCLGEVDDVLVMLEIARRQPYADPERVGIFGGSHGGCITLRALQRGAPAQVGVAFAPPTDFDALYRGWSEVFETLAPAERAQLQSLMTVVRDAAGGTPDEVPDEYRRRSPLAFAGDLAAVSSAVFILHGDADVVVPPRHACDLAAATGGFEAFHVGPDALETTAAPSGCQEAELDWQEGPRPATRWPGERYLVVYDGVPHALLPDHAPSAAAFNDLLTTLAAKLPP